MGSWKLSAAAIPGWHPQNDILDGERKCWVVIA